MTAVDPFSIQTFQNIPPSKNLRSCTLQPFQSHSTKPTHVYTPKYFQSLGLTDAFDTDL